MASQVPPLKNSAYTYTVALTSQADTDIFKTTPTLAAGDVTVSIDGGNFANVGTLPSQIQTTGILEGDLTAAEMNGDIIAVRFNDAAGDEWQDLLVVIQTVTTNQIDDLATPATTWTYATRTLTQTASAVATALDSGIISIQRGDSLSVAITGLGSIAGRTKLWFTVKTSRGNTDAQSIIQIEETAGLVYLNGADASGRAANGDITVDDEDAGDITITLDEVETDDLEIATRLYYDVQVLNGGDVTTLGSDLARVVADVTRVVA